MAVVERWPQFRGLEYRGSTVYYSCGTVACQERAEEDLWRPCQTIMEEAVSFHKRK